MGSYSRVRSIKLKRRSPEDLFGFTLRGGQEHGTGIFVSSVTVKSIAQKQGLKVGDQVLRVNGLPLSAATHAECLAFISDRNYINLKIRSVGMIPVKDSGEPLTWFLVENEPFLLRQSESKNGAVDLKQRHRALTPKRSDMPHPDTLDQAQQTIYINTNGHAGLGCCICRGPPQKPGIFVQSTKSNGVAREAGLRPGDQILECNGHSFTDVQFPEAIYHLKASNELRLIVIKGGACDLFPGESSGYNSSASSVNGETITSHLSVGSETSSNSDNLEHALRTVHIPSGQEIDEPKTSGVALDRNMEWEEVEQVWRSAKKESLIIQIKGADPIEDQIRHKELQLSLERRNLKEEQRKLQEEAENLKLEKLKFEEEKRKVLQRTELDSRAPLTNGPNKGHSLSALAGALSNEILKRSSRRENQQPNGVEGKGPAPELPANAHPALNDDIKRRQHEQLIEEFKRAHQKMFAPTLKSVESADVETNENTGPLREERASFRAKRIQKELEHTTKMVQNHVAGIVRQRQLRFERQHQEVQETVREGVADDKPKNRAPVNNEGRKSSPVPKYGTQVPPAQFPPPAIRIVSKIDQPLIKTLEEHMHDKVQNRGRKAHHVEFSDRPESPSPDYSNTPSPEFGRRYINRKPAQQTRSLAPGILKT